jgi:hypothetical protein
LIKSQLLYQLSYRGKSFIYKPFSMVLRLKFMIISPIYIPHLSGDENTRQPASLICHQMENSGHSRKFRTSYHTSTEVYIMEGQRRTASSFAKFGNNHLFYGKAGKGAYPSGLRAACSSIKNKRRSVTLRLLFVVMS